MPEKRSFTIVANLVDIPNRRISPCKIVIANGFIQSVTSLGESIDPALSFAMPGFIAPGLMGEQAAAYIAAGISTDHECTTLEEAEHKLLHGMKILIREGIAAKNFDALKSLIDSHTCNVMFCSDDKHPDELAEGHINVLVKRAIDGGAELFNVLRVACINAIEHYGLPSRQIRPGDAADFIVVDNLDEFNTVHDVIVHGIAGHSQAKAERSRFI